MKLSSPVEHEQTERGLATTRVLLAVGLLVAQHLGLAEAETLAGQRPQVLDRHLLVLLFGVYSVLIPLLTRLCKVSTWRWRLTLNGLDAVWPCLFSVSTGTPSSACLALAIFALLAAALRSGLHAAVMTAGVILVFVLLQAIYLPSLTNASGPEVYEAFAPPELAMRPAYLLLVSVVVGYLLERERQRLAESSVLERVAAQLNRERGLGNVLGIIGRELTGISLAPQVLFVSEERRTGRALLWELNQTAAEAENLAPRARALDAAKHDCYLFPMQADCWHAVRLTWPNDRVEVVALDRGGDLTLEIPDTRFTLLATSPACVSAAVFSIGARDTWSGRFLLLNPVFDNGRHRSLRFLQRLVHLAAPVVHDAHLLHNLRSRARAFERARLVRRLHDDVIPSLVAAAMHVDTLRRRAGPRCDLVGLGHIEQVLHEETLKLRDVMQRLKPIAVAPDERLVVLADLIDRFQRDAGIAASLSGTMEIASLTPRTYGKLLRIVQEALVNVRKHSGARHVSIHLIQEEGVARMIIEDDGHGFPVPPNPIRDGAVSGFSRMSAWPPRPRLTVIEECVRSIDSELTVQSSPGHGVRLEVRIPILARPRSQGSRQPRANRNGLGLFFHRCAATMSRLATPGLRTRPDRDWVTRARLDWYRRAPK